MKAEKQWLFEPVELSALCDTVRGRLQSKAAGKGITLRIEGEPAAVSGQRRTLEQMIFNLTDNAINYNIQGFDCGIYRTVSAGGGLELLTRNVQPDAGYRTDTYAARHLQVFQFDTMILRAVRTCQYQNIIVVNIFLLIGKFQEIFVNLIQFLLIQSTRPTPAGGSSRQRVRYGRSVR